LKILEMLSDGRINLLCGVTLLSLTEEKGLRYQLKTLVRITILGSVNIQIPLYSSSLISAAHSKPMTGILHAPIGCILPCTIGLQNAAIG
jgi:hypothetical protein